MIRSALRSSTATAQTAASSRFLLPQNSILLLSSRLLPRSTINNSPSILLNSQLRSFHFTAFRPSTPPPLNPTTIPPASSASSNSPPAGFARLRALFRTHGWSALVVYLFFSAIDFTLMFFLIYAVGADRVRAAEDWVLEGLGWRRKDGEPGRVKMAVEGWREDHHLGGSGRHPPHPVVEHDAEHELVKKPAEKSMYSALATTAVLAYAIHKTLLLPVRLGLTVWITPRVVRTLQSWGWKVGMAGTSATVASTAASSKA